MPPVLVLQVYSLYKLYTYVPEQAAGTLLDALFAAGAGQIGEYSECSFTAKGKGSFKPSAQSNPVIGTAGGSREAPEEVKLELIVPKHLKSTILQILKQNHPYEEVAYELIRLENENQTVGAGLTGELDAPMEAGAFLAWVKKQMKTACIRHTPLHVAEIKKVAVCGDSGSFLLPDAIKHQADIFITGDFKYHQFFDAEGKIIIADIRHYESEQFTIEIFSEIIKKKFLILHFFLRS